MSSDPKTHVGTPSHGRKPDHSLIVRWGKAAFEATGHGVYVLPVVLALFGLLAYFALVPA